MKRAIIERIQKRTGILERRFQEKVNGWSKAKKIAVLFIIIFPFAFSSAYSLLTAFKPRTKNSRRINFQKIENPPHLGDYPDSKKNNSTIPDRVFARIESLKSNDSLLKARPKLMDTILIIEQMHQSLQKK